jgi:imidazolonepropionase-like amidohydrolase
LQLATLGAARVMKRDKTEGSIARGKVADFFLVDGRWPTSPSCAR